MIIDLGLIKSSLPNLLRGAFVSIQIAAISCAIGITLGTLFGLAQTRKNKFLRFLIGVYVTIFRGTPMLVQLIFAYYVLPQFGIKIPAFWTATTAIGLNSAAYVSQIIRSGINAVSSGQLEAAYTLGLSQWQTIRYILLPQAFMTVIPALGNEFIVLIKDSSLASIINVIELRKEAERIVSVEYDYFSIYLAIAAIYLIMTSTLSYLMAKLEKRMNQHVKN